MECAEKHVFFQSTQWQLVLCLLVEQTSLESGLVWVFFFHLELYSGSLYLQFFICPVISLGLESVACRHLVSCKAEVILHSSKNVACLVILLYSDEHIFKTLSVWTRREYINLMYFCMNFQECCPRCLRLPLCILEKLQEKHLHFFGVLGWF